MRAGPKAIIGLGAPAALRALTLSKGGGFNLAAFMAAQSDGFWYDFSKTDRLFQENVGPTPADDPNEVIGLALSQRLWSNKTLAAYLASQPELVTNGDFSSGTTGWSASGSASLSEASQRLTITIGGGGGAATQAITTVAGRSYALLINYQGGTAGSPTLRVGTTSAGFNIVSSAMTAGVNTVYFTALASTTYISAASGATGTIVIDDVSVKEASRYPATQATGTLKPKFQTTGAAFDGSDDNLLTGYTVGATNNFMVAKVTVPATIAATQVVAGAVDGASKNFYLGFTTGGLLRAGIGSTPATLGAVDRRGTEVVVGITTDGTTYRGFEGSVQAGPDTAVSGAANSGVGMRLGAMNSNGTANAFFGGSIRSIVAGRQFLDPSTFNQIASAL